MNQEGLDDDVGVDGETEARDAKDDREFGWEMHDDESGRSIAKGLKDRKE